MINWREIPFIRLFIPFVTGILCAWWGLTLHSFAVYGLISGGLGIIALTFFRLSYRYRWAFAVPAALFLFSLGFLRAFQMEDLSKQPLISGEGIYSGVMVSEPQASNRWQKGFVRLTAKRDSSGSWQLLNTKAMIYWETPDSSTKFSYGDKLLLNADFRLVEGPKNPGAFDFRSWLRSQYVYYQAFLKEGEMVHEGKGSPSLMSIALRCRNILLKRLEDCIPAERARGVVAALVLGSRKSLDPQIKEAYANTGAIHVLAVSGLHVGLIYLVLQFLLKFLMGEGRRGRRIQAVFLLAGIWAFAFLTGGAPSVLRASTMFSFVIVGKALNRTASIYNTLGASACFLLWLQPYLLLQLGFQLSYLAVIGIVFFQHRIYQLWIPQNKILDGLWKLTTVSLAAQLTTTPISIFYFHQFPTYFWLSGLIVVPAASLILSATLLLLLFSYCFLPGARWLGAALSYGLDGMNFLITQIEELPGSLIRNLWLDSYSLWGIYFVLFLIMLALQRKKARLLMVALFFLLVLSIHRMYRKWQQAGQQEVVLYAMGEHFLMDVISGSRAYAFQSGGISVQQVAYAAENYRLSRGIKEVTYLPDTIEAFSAPGIFYKSGCLVTDDKLGMILRAKSLSAACFPDTLDWIIIANDPKLEMEKVISKLPNHQIIISENNSRKQQENWKTQLKAINADSYLVREKGAWRFDPKTIPKEH
jgi:competence protein ComEC